MSSATPRVLGVVGLPTGSMAWDPLAKPAANEQHQGCKRGLSALPEQLDSPSWLCQQLGDCCQCQHPESWFGTTWMRRFPLQKNEGNWAQDIFEDPKAFVACFPICDSGQAAHFQTRKVWLAALSCPCCSSLQAILSPFGLHIQQHLLFYFGGWFLGGGSPLCCNQSGQDKQAALLTLKHSPTCPSCWLAISSALVLPVHTTSSLLNYWRCQSGSLSCCPAWHVWLSPAPQLLSSTTLSIWGWNIKYSREQQQWTSLN